MLSDSRIVHTELPSKYARWQPPGRWRAKLERVDNSLKSHFTLFRSLSNRLHRSLPSRRCHRQKHQVAVMPLWSWLPPALLSSILPLWTLFNLRLHDAEAQKLDAPQRQQFNRSCCSAAPKPATRSRCKWREGWLASRWADGAETRTSGGSGEGVLFCSPRPRVFYLSYLLLYLEACAGHRERQLTYTNHESSVQRWGVTPYM